jgi:hypothetical protein
MGQGIANYLASTNEIEVVRPGESSKRKIRCTNFDPKHNKFYGLEIHGDEIWLLSSGPTNSLPNRKHIYKFSSLSGGSSSDYRR